MDLIALDLHAAQGLQRSRQGPDPAPDPGAPFFRRKNRFQVQVSQSLRGSAFLGPVRIRDPAAQHLVAAADAEDHASPLPHLIDRRRHAAVTQPAQVRHGILRSRQNDHIGIAQGIRPRHVAQIDLQDSGKNIEIREVGQVRNPNNSDLHGFPRRRPVGLRQLRRQGILVVDVQLHVGHHADDRDPAPLLQHGDPRIQDGLVAPEFVDDKTLEQGLLVRIQQHLRAQKLGKDPAAVNVAGQQDRCADGFCQAHVDDVILFQIDLGGAPGALNDNDIILRSQRPIGLQDHGHEAPLVGEILPGVHVAQDLAPHNDLGSGICGGLEQDRVHPDIRLDPGGFRLHDLGPPHLQPIGCDVGVEGHILGFERGDPVAVLPEDPAQTGRQQALARIGHGPLDHDCFRHFLLRIFARH